MSSSRMSCGLTLFLFLLLGTAALSQTVTFSRTTQGPISSKYHVDLNNDGREDFIYFDQSCANGFEVALSTGDETYAAPKCYTLPASPPVYIAIGDFNHDGNPDLIVTNGTRNFYEYLNNASGSLHLQATFVTNTTVGSVVASDINHDGKIDLVFDSIGGNDSNLYVWFGNGDGGFTPGPITKLTVVGELSIGDFDGDGKADVMSEFSTYTSGVEVLYGDGAGHFPVNALVSDNARLAPSDVNGDGRMDLSGGNFDFSINGSRYYKTIDVFEGNSNRTFTKKTITLGQCTPGSYPPAVGDFNGDGINDLAVIEAADCSGNGPDTLNILLGNGDNTYQPEQAVYSSGNAIYNPFSVRLNRDTKADITISEDTNSGAATFFTNTTPGNFPGCAAPDRGIGITLCRPTSSVVASSPVKFSIGASNQTPARKVEVWIDGKKMSQNLKQAFSYYSYLDASYAVGSGTHQVTVYSAGWDNLLESFTFPLTVGSSCAAPTSPGLNVCSPLNDSTLRPSALAWASGTVSGKILRMEVWVDGEKKYSTFGSNTLKTTLTLGSGVHRFTYYIVNTSGTKWEKTVYASIP